MSDKTKDIVKVRCIVACHNSNGQPELVPVTVSCTPDDYDNGRHYAIARALAEEENYETHAWQADENDPGFVDLEHEFKVDAGTSLPLQTVRFVPASALGINDIEDMWGALSEGAPFSWGDNNRSMVTASDFKTHFDNVAALFKGVDEEVDKKVDRVTEILAALGETYIDLEN